MAHIRFELEVRPEEKSLTDVLTVIAATPVDDCRKLRPLVEEAIKQSGLQFVVGGGGSHLWIHRAEQYMEGQHTHVDNERFAIITD